MAVQKTKPPEQNATRSKPGEANIFSYLATAMGAAVAGSVLRHVVGLPPLSIKDPTTLMTIAVLSTTILNFLGSYGIEPRNTRKLRPITRGLGSLAIGFAGAAFMVMGAENQEQYKKERAAMPLIDSKTVLGMREYTVADEQCKYKSRGQEIKFIHEGKLSRTVCP